MAKGTTLLSSPVVWISHAMLVVMVVCGLLASNDNKSFGFAQPGSCESYNFTCCSMLQYPVFSITASNYDTETCTVIKEIGQNPTFSKPGCLEAYATTFCLTNIPVCCSAFHPAVSKPCRTACENTNAACGFNVFDCTSTQFFDPPCNVGAANATELLC
eukprot:TRINITY_DN5653_c0_g1_i1.p1 TRINITY_DN5653_c0_g1~~TRINITY_DN5653_c0_g1_i1.p1  ORF type:complete len:175 (+),score=26.51 TRINITY_DN5653_c0_g1_i1:50-526(+)